jgi:hypothetical protein
MEEKVIWYNRKYLVLFLTIVVWPVGFYALYKSDSISKSTKIIWTIGFVINVGLLNAIQSIPTKIPESNDYEIGSLNNECDRLIVKIADLNKECKGLKTRSYEGLYDIPNIISDYNETKDSITNITLRFNKLGYNKSNDAVIDLIKTRVKQLEAKLPSLRKKADIENEKYLEQIRNSSFSSSNNEESGSKTCSWCNKKFSGPGWNYSMGNCYQKEGMYWSKCSSKCCNESLSHDPAAMKWRNGY